MKTKKKRVAKFKLKADALIQVDVRSAVIPSKTASQYFLTFHSSLEKAGMKKVQVKDSTLLKFPARQTEYETKRKARRFRVTVLEFYSDGKAWLILAVVPEDKRVTSKKEVEALISSFQF